MTQSALSTVSAAIGKDELSILEASDDRELLSQGQDDFLPYELPFDALVDVLEVKARRNHDSRGVFVTLRVVESSAPAEVKVGKQYVLAFFDAHKTIPEFVLGQMARSRKEFAASLVPGASGDDPNFKAGPVLAQLHKQVEPLHISMRFTSKFVRKTRNGKAIHALSFARA
jgi:hypothetical protein